MQKEIEENEVEKDEEDDTDEVDDFEKEKEVKIPKEIYDVEMVKIKADPYKYICGYAEKILINVGQRVFRYVALMPVSLFLPDLPINSSIVKTNWNLVIVGSPSIGKTTICNMFCDFTFNPIKVKKVTLAHLVLRLIREKVFSISLDDFANLMNDNDGYAKVKALESSLGDDRMLSSDTMKYQTGEVKVQGIGVIPIIPIP